MKTVIVYQTPSGHIRLIETFDWVQTMASRRILDEVGWEYDVEVIN